MKHYLFSYGTLQLEKVQLESFGRILKGKEDTLTGYSLEKLEITDRRVLDKSNQQYHPVAVRTDCLKGVFAKPGCYPACPFGERRGRISLQRL